MRYYLLIVAVTVLAAKLVQLSSADGVAADSMETDVNIETVDVEHNGEEVVAESIPRGNELPLAKGSLERNGENKEFWLCYDKKQKIRKPCTEQNRPVKLCKDMFGNIKPCKKEKLCTDKSGKIFKCKLQDVKLCKRKDGKTEPCSGQNFKFVLRKSPGKVVPWVPDHRKS